jgi:hypothetical protein
VATMLFSPPPAMSCAAGAGGAPAVFAC